MKYLLIIAIALTSIACQTAHRKPIESMKAQTVVKASDSHLCGFVGKNKKACTRKVNNESGLTAKCFQHRDKITDSEVEK